MEVTLNEVREIVESLPIGLYASRRVPTEMSLEAETSYYVPQDDRIVISYPIIARGLATIQETEEYSRETAVRSMVYHELSHAILTPTTDSFMNRYTSIVPADVFNIFEDERIETVLKDYYLDVNFKRQVLAINGGTITPPTNALSAFYNIVRFRNGNPTFVERVDNIIEQYAKINHSYDYWNSYDYLTEIYCLWRDIQDECRDKGMPEVSDEDMESFMNDMANIDINNNMAKSGKGEIAKGNGSESEDEGNKGNSDNEGENGENEANGYSDGNEDKDSPKTRSVGPGGVNARELFDEAFSTYDASVYDTLNNIISQFNKKNSKGNGTMSYSGVFNPRAVMRNDYKYFERKSSVQGINSYGTLHLNLFLDDSGSFCDNEAICNKVIQALIEIEKRNKNFTFDVYFVADNYRKANNNVERYIHPCGGNRLGAELYEMIRKAQKPSTYNYNIALFDGEATWGYSHSNRDNPENFGAFNRSNMTIVSDKDNRKYMEQYCTSARRIYTKNYVQDLTKIICDTLVSAFR